MRCYFSEDDFPFIDLHIHTTFSDGCLTPLKIIDRCPKDSCISITDHNSWDFYLTNQTISGIKLIPGIELRIFRRPELLWYHPDGRIPSKALTLIKTVRDFDFSVYVSFISATLSVNENYAKNLIKEWLHAYNLPESCSIGNRMIVEIIHKVRSGSRIFGNINFVFNSMDPVHLELRKFIRNAYLTTENKEIQKLVAFTDMEFFSFLQNIGGTIVLAHPYFTYSLIHPKDVLDGDLIDKFSWWLENLRNLGLTHIEYSLKDFCKLIHDRRDAEFFLKQLVIFLREGFGDPIAMKIMILTLYLINLMIYCK